MYQIEMYTWNFHEETWDRFIKKMAKQQGAKFSKEVSQNELRKQSRLHMLDFDLEIVYKVI